MKTLQDCPNFQVNKDLVQKMKSLRFKIAYLAENKYLKEKGAIIRFKKNYFLAEMGSAPYLKTVGSMVKELVEFQFIQKRIDPTKVAINKVRGNFLFEFKFFVDSGTAAQTELMRVLTELGVIRFSYSDYAMRRSSWKTLSFSYSDLHLLSEGGQGVLLSELIQELEPVFNYFSAQFSLPVVEAPAQVDELDLPDEPIQPNEPVQPDERTGTARFIPLVAIAAANAAAMGLPTNEILIRGTINAEGFIPAEEEEIQF